MLAEALPPADAEANCSMPSVTLATALALPAVVLVALACAVALRVIEPALVSVALASPVFACTDWEIPPVTLAEAEALARVAVALAAALRSMTPVALLVNVDVASP